MNITKDPIHGLILKIAIPSSIGFFFHTMYNVVDTYFAGLHSTDALAALAISFPVFFIIISIGYGISQGITVLLSNALGANQLKEAKNIFVQSISYTFFVSLFLTPVGIALAPHLFEFLGAKEQYLDLSLSYMNVLFLGTVSFMAAYCLNAALNSMGDTKSFRNMLIITFLMNCALNPIFMFGFGFIPAMGLKGIALSTVVTEGLGAIYLLHRVRKTELWCEITFKKLVPNFSCYKDISAQGLPASFTMMTVAIGIFIITWYISQFGKVGVAAYGIATRIEQIALLLTIGLNSAVLTISGQNYGAKLYHRIREVWLHCLKIGFVIMFASGIILYFSNHWLMSLFTTDGDVVREGGIYLSIASFALFAYTVLFSTNSMLQGIKRPMFGVWLGISRQIILPVLVFHFLSFTLGWGLIGIWWGVFFIVWIAAVFSFMYGLRKLKLLST